MAERWRLGRRRGRHAAGGTAAVVLGACAASALVGVWSLAAAAAPAEKGGAAAIAAPVAGRCTALPAQPARRCRWAGRCTALPGRAPAPAGARAREVARAAVAEGQTLLECSDLYGTHDEIRTLFKVEKLVLRRGQKMAVVGANGCGKSTLIRALGGKEQLPGGTIEVAPGVQVVVVEQAPDYDPEQTVQDVVFAKAVSQQAQATRQYHRALATGEGLEEALERMEAASAWDWDDRATEVMTELGLGELLSRPIGQLSGGEERRVALATALVDLGATDLLILDEPTNHLSAEGCDWLQETLQAARDLSVVLVTHDRYFLDEVCDQILEIDGLGETYSHPGGWNTFLEGRAKRWEEAQALKDDARVQLRRAKEWMARGARGRQGKSKMKIAQFYDLKAKSEELVSADDGAPDLVKSGYAGQREGAPTDVGLRNATVTVPRRGNILDQVDLVFEKGSKVGIVGPNGAGKSTFLRTIAGEQELAYGEVVVGMGVRMGFLNQEPPQFDDPKQRVLQFVAEVADEAAILDGTSAADLAQPMKAAAGLLKSVNFNKEKWQTEVGMLSGGEKRRLQLLKVLSQKPNVLLLDEPTNDLDAVTVDSLEQLLRNFEGTIIVVSHDRSLLDGVCNMHVVFFKDSGKPRLWLGSHAELREWQTRQQQEEDLAAASRVAKEAEAEAKVKADAIQEPSISQKERRAAQKEFNKVEKDIESLDEKMAQIDEEIQESASDFSKVSELSATRDQLAEKQQELYQRWEELADILG